MLENEIIGQFKTTLEQPLLEVEGLAANPAILNDALCNRVGFFKYRNTGTRVRVGERRHIPGSDPRKFQDDLDLYRNDLDELGVGSITEFLIHGTLANLKKLDSVLQAFQPEELAQATDLVLPATPKDLFSAYMNREIPGQKRIGKVSQNIMAREVGISQGYVSNLLNGRKTSFDYFCESISRMKIPDEYKSILILRIVKNPQSKKAFDVQSWGRRKEVASRFLSDMSSYSEGHKFVNRVRGFAPSAFVPEDGGPGYVSGEAMLYVEYVDSAGQVARVIDCIDQVMDGRLNYSPRDVAKILISNLVPPSITTRDQKQEISSYLEAWAQRGLYAEHVNLQTQED